MADACAGILLLYHAALAREWELNQLARRLEELDARS